VVIDLPVFEPAGVELEVQAVVENGEIL